MIEVTTHRHESSLGYRDFGEESVNAGLGDMEREEEGGVHAR